MIHIIYQVYKEVRNIIIYISVNEHLFITLEGNAISHLKEEITSFVENNVDLVKYWYFKSCPEN